ncbi:mannitol dehydrogenase [Kaistia algarum]|uniref:mannitol dehydrogenase family protein n=1 Tax=Kaistia algarum TaxID=2083279 RepID=UPI000CE73E87|nr:mannitol dehydrogenase family protein [Kaistia algarum]MCX5515403.1 mannitol dehydrogenase family protein [Kaistia algarum]PPE78534.1 mannitol dehydrogenase [Kaistia algarum]
MTERLDTQRLAALPAAILRPAYDRAAVRPGIVHLGVGAFHRAHEAVAIDDCLAAGDSGWGIVAASLRSPDTRDALNPQDGLYTVVDRDSEGDRFRVIGAILRVLVAPEDPAALVAAMADPNVRIVSLTVTEKGYTRRSDGTLDEDHPDIRHDLAEWGRPRSALGFLAAALEARKAAGVPPFTALSCDNLPSNGATLKALLTRFAELRSPELGTYVRDKVACSSTMVDRIVPATTDSDRALVDDALGVTDAWPVVTEPYYSWVIEDDFPAGRPDIRTPGVLFVEDVAPYELMKLRLLNGAHSTLAYAGLLLGHDNVAAAFTDPDARALVDALWRESAATLPDAGLDSDDYCARLAIRFGNRALRHKLDQIGTDGSEKLPQRIAMPLRENLAAGRKASAQASAIAFWIAALERRGKGEFAFTDPRLDRLTTLAAQADANAAAGDILALLGLGDQLEAARALVSPVLELIRREGARAAIRTVAAASR